MAPHDYHLVRIAKKRDHTYSHVNHIMSCYQKPKYTKGGSSIKDEITIMAAGLPQQIATKLSDAETVEDQNGLEIFYAVFNNESGRDWSDLTLLDTKDGLVSFVTWASAINSDRSNDDLALPVFEDPLRGIPKTFKNYMGYSPIIVLAVRRPEGDTLSDAGDYIKKLLSNSIEIEAFVAKGLIEDIAVPEAGENKDHEDDRDEDDEDEDHETSGDDDDETSGDDDGEASGDEDKQDGEMSD